MPSLRTFVGSFALAAVLVAPAAAQFTDETRDPNTPVRVTIGNTPTFTLRIPDAKLNMTVKQRDERVQIVFAKHLGGPGVRFTRKAYGPRVHLYMNGDFLLAISPEDASATGFKSAAQLAPVWERLLVKAFEATHANPRRAGSQ